MSQDFQAVLLIAFGGPTRPEEIRPFLERVTRGIPIPAARLDEVAHHYEAVGGKSPLNEITLRQAEALRELLAQRGAALPVYVGMRNSEPFFTETLKQMFDDGIRRALGFILSAQRSEASWERYQKNIADARRELGDRSPEFEYCPGWHDHPLFIQTWTELIRKAYDKAGEKAEGAIPLLFTAHSLPRPMAARSPYAEQVKATAGLVANALGHSNWSVAYQSRSGKPTDPWLEPDIGEVIKELAAQGNKRIVAAPIGFVCDHVEVLYDLDIEAKNLAESAGIELIRAVCPNDHPTFIRMIAEVIMKTIKTQEDRR